MNLISFAKNSSVKRGNTVGSTNVDFCNWLKDEESAYIAGLWCADGYHRTSSIGLSNVDTDLISRFSEFLRLLFPDKRIKKRIYEPFGKRKQRAYHIYVNCRPLLRSFFKFKADVAVYLKKDRIIPYLAGRFDGDGSVASDFYRDCRIVYGNQAEAERDLVLLNKIGFSLAKIYRYKAAKTHCLYISRLETKKFLSAIYKFSTKLQKSTFVPRRDLISR